MSREGKSREKTLNIWYNMTNPWKGGCAVLEQQLSSAGETLRRYPKSRAKEKLQQDKRRGKIAFRIKPHTCQRGSEGSNMTFCTTGPRD